MFFHFHLFFKLIFIAFALLNVTSNELVHFALSSNLVCKGTFFTQNVLNIDGLFFRLFIILVYFISREMDHSELCLEISGFLNENLLDLLYGLCLLFSHRLIYDSCL